MLLNYNEDVQGVPISFSDLNFPPGKEYARILAEQYWLHVDVTTTFLVFKPTIGSTLCGQINKVSDSHVSLLIFGMFNASISSDELVKKYTFNFVLDGWESIQGQEGLLVGDLVDCVVLGLQHGNGVLNMNVSLAR